MRVLMLTQFYPPLIGGEERFVQKLSRALSAQGHQISVVTLKQGDLSAYEQDDAIQIHRVNSTLQQMSWLYSDRERPHAPPLPDPAITQALAAIIEREKPDVVHAHNWIVHSFLPLKQKSGAKLVVSLHDYSLICANKKLIRHDATCVGPELRNCVQCSLAHYGKIKGVATLAAQRISGAFEQRVVDMFLPVSSAVATGNQLSNRKLPYRVIPNFVPDEIERGENASGAYLGRLPDTPFMLFVGAFGAYKGVDVLINAYRRAQEKTPNLPALVIIGYDTQEYPIQTKEFPPNVYIFKNWPHAAVMAAWHRCAFGLIPSLWPDPCPTVAMEAMSASRPVIASRIGGLTDLVADGETGRLVPAGDIDALSEAMVWFTQNAQIGCWMGENASRHLKTFQASTVIPQFEQAYLDVMGKEKISNDRS